VRRWAIRDREAREAFNHDRDGRERTCAVNAGKLSRGTLLLRRPRYPTAHRRGGHLSMAN